LEIRKLANIKMPDNQQYKSIRKIDKMSSSRFLFLI